MWAALAGARVAPSGWRRARAMLHFDRTGELKRRFLLTAVERNKSSQLRLRALQEIAAGKDPEAVDLSIDVVQTWSREERREAAKIMLQALAEKRIGRRDQANAWIWRLAEDTREVHEEYAVQRLPETKRLLGLLVNSSGHAHARNARRLVHASRKHDRRLQAALLAAAVAHTPEAEEVLRGARTRLARKPSALSRELLRNFPKGRRGRNRRRRKKGGEAEAAAPVQETLAGRTPDLPDEGEDAGAEAPARRRRGRRDARRGRGRGRAPRPPRPRGAAAAPAGARPRSRRRTASCPTPPTGSPRRWPPPPRRCRRPRASRRTPAEGRTPRPGRAGRRAKPAAAPAGEEAGGEPARRGAGAQAAAHAREARPRRRRAMRSRAGRSPRPSRVGPARSPPRAGRPPPAPRTPRAGRSTRSTSSRRSRAGDGPGEDAVADALRAHDRSAAETAAEDHLEERVADTLGDRPAGEAA